MMRQPTLQPLTEMLAGAIVGANLPGTPPEDLYVLPVWAWAPSRVDVGRRDRIDETERYDMPIRLDWDVPLVGSVSGIDGHVATARTRGVGYDQSIIIDLSTAPRTPMYESEPVLEFGLDQAPPVLRTGNAVHASRVLETLADMRHTDYWRLLEWIERYARRKLPSTLTSIWLSLGRTDRDEFWQVDDPTQEEILSAFVLASDGDEGSDSYAMRLVDRCLRPEAFEKADPRLVMTRSIKRDLAEQARRVLGDPRAGGKIRQLASDMGVTGTSDEEIRRVADEYRRRFDDPKMGPGRVREALHLRNAPSFVNLGGGGVAKGMDTTGYRNLEISRRA